MFEKLRNLRRAKTQPSHGHYYRTTPLAGLLGVDVEGRVRYAPAPVTLSKANKAHRARQALRRTAVTGRVATLRPRCAPRRGPRGGDPVMFDNLRRAAESRRLARYLRPFPADDRATRSAQTRAALTPAASHPPICRCPTHRTATDGTSPSRDSLWPACRDALIGTAPASRAEWPTPGMPPVLVLADDVRIDRLPAINGQHVVLITDPAAGRTVATLQLTPDAAASIVSGLMPAAALAPRIADALLADLTGHPETGSRS